jgi:DNA-binding GntR family transcriptional regulator
VPPPDLRIALADRARGGTRQRVYDALRDALVAGRLEPGRRLSENELAEALGVSRTPVREALVRLRDDRMVEIVPQLGTFVSKISIGAVADAQFVREALECAAIRLAAGRVSPSELEQLGAIVGQQDEAHAAHDFDRFFVLDDAFHEALCEASGHGIAWSLAQRADGHLVRVRRLSLPVPEYMGEMIDEHRAVLRAVEAHDPDRAEESLRHHLRMVLSVLESIRAEHPEFFAEA